ncbi:InlB B-repeat-containing protein [Candidatus Cryosericum septentrionale]|uniref:InlB B-repeat-containing protein n=1 Tax=Candidatus Cryosericum septentrionale TaxID=2290913 RepID=UPI00140353A2|nr:tandem-95 repeat protein [Candidatus Cryosericum septentrionale]
MKRWKVGKRDWRSWVLGSTLILLLLVQLLIVPSAVQAATAVDDVVSTNEDASVTISVLGNDTGSGLKVASVTAPGNGTAVILDESAGTILYTPASDWNGTDTFTYTVSEGSTLPSATVTVTVTAVNDAPSFTKGANQTVLEDCGPKAVVSWATLISAGPVNESSQSLSFVVTNNYNALFSVQPAVSLTTGTLTYTPAPNQYGSTVVSVCLQDSGGMVNGGVDTSPAQTFTITVGPVNDAPSFVVGLDVSVVEDYGQRGIMSWATSITTGSGDPYSQALTFQVTGNSNPSLFADCPVIQAIGGRLSFTMAANKNGTATITLVLHDDGGTANGGVDTSAPQTFTITVTPVNDVPSFTKGADQMVLEDCGSQTVAGWASAISAGPSDETGQALDFIVTNDNNPLFAVQPAVAANGTLIYISTLNRNGTATVTVRIHDDGGTANGGVDTSAPQTFTITVGPVNDPPVNTILPSSAGAMNIGDTLATSPGTWDDTIDIAVSGTSTLTYTYRWVRADDASGMNAVDIASATSSTYVLSDLDAHKYLCVRVTCTDSGVGLPTAQSVTLPTPWTSQVINRLPVITEGASTSATMDEDGSPTSFSLTLHATDTDSDTLTWSVPSGASHGTGTATGTGTAKAITYAPAPDWNASDSFVVQVSDGYGGTASITVNITVNLRNDVPSFTKGADQTVLEDCGVQTVSGWATAVSAGPADEAGQTLDFFVTNDNAILFSTQPALAENGTLMYTPAANMNGTATVSISLHDDGGTANGGVDTSAPQMFTITVTAVNDPPADTYTLTYTAGTNGTISGTSPQTVNHGTSGTLVTAVPNVGYHFVSWSDGVLTAARTDANVTANINATATFAVDTFTVTPSTGSNGSISPSTTQIVDYGSNLTFTIKSSTGYHVQDVLVDGVSVGAVPSYTFTNVTVSHTIAANFAIDTYTLTVNVTGSSSIAKSPDQASYNHGASVQLTATPVTGWHFTGWSGSLTGSTNPATITMDANKTITATFAIDMYTIVASADLAGNISPSGNVMVNHGASQSFSITPSTGYHIQNVLVDGSSVGAVTSYTFTNLTENHTIAASFAIDTYTLTYMTGTNGTISGTSPQTVNHGTSGTLVTAVPNVRYHFVSWSDGVLTAARTDANVTANINATTTFAVSINTYTLTVSVSGSGSVAKNPDQISYTHGTSVQLTATPASGWHFVGWSGGLSGTTNSATITMDASKTVTAAYAPLPHPVSGHTMVLTIGSKTMTVDGTEVALDAPAALLEDRTLVPLRAVVEHLGGTISWNAKTRQVTLKARGTTIILTIGKSTALVNGKPLVIDPKNRKVVPILSSSRTMLPLRFVAENLGLQVDWDAKARTITVSWED